MHNTLKQKPRLGGEAVTSSSGDYNSTYFSKYNSLRTSVADIIAALNGRNLGNESGICRCPAHDDKNPSLSIKSGDGGKLIVFCHAGCSYTDIMAALRSMGLVENNGYAQIFTPKPKLAPQNESLDWSAKAESIWRKSIALQGTVGEVYLLNRGCALPTGDDVRFLPAYKDGYPAMLARFRDTVTGNPISLHFTYLLPDGSGKAPIKPAKKTLFGHRIKDGVIRLTADDEVTTGLGLAEGIETALTVAKSGWQPVWVAGNKNNIADFPVLDGIECLTIFADNDAVGMKAATDCAERWLRAGREVKIVKSPTPETDWNDIYGRAAI